MNQITGMELLELAATVIWPFKGLHCPLGDLLASGEVQARDLGWATWKAHDPIVKWAAAVQLKAKDLQQETFFLSAARAVIWPFKNFKRPIGDLLDEQIISLHDLAYAVAQAYSPEVRDAAAVLGAEIVRRQLPLGAPQPSRNAPPPLEETTPASPATSTISVAAVSALPLQIIKGSDYLVRQIQRKRRWIIVLALAILYLWLGALAISVIALIALAFQLGQVPLGWMIASGVLLAGAWFILPQLDRLTDEFEQYHRGRKGEQLVAAGLQRVLKRPWILFRNVVLPGQQDDIDAVLVGAKGIYALEIKAFTGYYRNVGDRWQRRYAFFWRDLSRNPSRQALRNAQRLHDYLQKCDVTVWVEPRVVWASKSKLWLKQPTVPVWQMTRGRFIGEDLARGKPLDEVTRSQIIASLKANNLSQSELSQTRR